MVPTRVHLADRPHRLRVSEPSICGMFIRDGVLKQNVRHICRLAVTVHECRPAPDNPYYRAFLERSFENHVRQRDLRLICEMRMLETE
jgi:hypothetical protein